MSWLIYPKIRLNFSLYLSKLRTKTFLHESSPSSSRSQLCNKTNCKEFGGRLVIQPSPNMKSCRTGFNLVHGKKWVCLDNLLISNFCETLGYKITSKYLSNHSPKIEIRDQLVLFLSSQKNRENPFCSGKEHGWLLS